MYMIKSSLFGILALGPVPPKDVSLTKHYQQHPKKAMHCGQVRYLPEAARTGPFDPSCLYLTMHCYP